MLTRPVCDVLVMLQEWGYTCLLAMFVVAGAGCEPSERASSSPEVVPVADRSGPRIGEPAPAFQLRDLEGNLVSLEGLRGKVVLVNFWATWCGPCRFEMPAMEQLYRAFNRKDFEILAVSTDPQGAAVTRPFQQEIGLSFPILHDPDFRIGIAYGARTLPMTFLIDRRGIIRHRIFGARDWQSPEAIQLIQSLVQAF